MSSQIRRQREWLGPGPKRRLIGGGFARPAVIMLAVMLAASLSVAMYIVALAQVGSSIHSSTGFTDRSFEFINLGHLGGPANAVDTDGAYAYVGFANELAVMEVQDPIQRIGYVLVETKIEDILVTAGYAYIAAGKSGLWVVDILNPRIPELIGHLDTPGYAHGLAKVANVLYLADGVGGLRIISVIDPSTPIEIGSILLPGHGLGIASSGRYAYVAIAEKGLQVVDVANPGQPVLLGSHDTSGLALNVVVRHQTAYIADGLGGLKLVDITAPDSPESISGLGVGGTAKDLFLDAGLAYVAADDAGLVIVDVSSPLNLTQKGTISTTSRSVSIAKFDQTILMANWSEGLQLIDVTDPGNPLWVSGYEPPANARGGIEAAGRTVYVGDDMGI